MGVFGPRRHRRRCRARHLGGAVVRGVVAARRMQELVRAGAGRSRRRRPRDQAGDDSPGGSVSIVDVHQGKRGRGSRRNRARNNACGNLRGQDHQLQLLAGLNIFLTRIGDFCGALSVAEQGAAVARATKNMAGLVMTDWMLGVSQHLVGNQAAAQRHCEDGMANAVELGQLNTNCFGYDHRIRALVALARALWLRGFSERALRIAQQTIDEAERRDHPVSVCISLIYAAPVFLWSGDLERAADFIDRLIAYAGRYSLAPYRAVGMALKGELAVTRGQAAAGLILLRNALETLHAERHNILATVFASALAEGLRKTGQFD